MSSEEHQAQEEQLYKELLADIRSVRNTDHWEELELIREKTLQELANYQIADMEVLRRCLAGLIRRQRERARAFLGYMANYPQEEEKYRLQARSAAEEMFRLIARDDSIRIALDYIAVKGLDAFRKDPLVATEGQTVEDDLLQKLMEKKRNSSIKTLERDAWIYRTYKANMAEGKSSEQAKWATAQQLMRIAPEKGWNAGNSDGEAIVRDAVTRVNNTLESG